MAGRENQGLQIALIIFVMITVALGTTTYIFYSQRDEARKLADKHKAEVAVANQEAEANKFAYELVKRTIGASKLNDAELETFRQQVAANDVAIDAEVGEIEALFERDMLKFGSEFPEERRNYRELPGYLTGVIQEKNDDLVASRTQVRELETKIDTVTKREQAKTLAAETAMNEYQTQLASARQTFKDDMDRVRKESIAFANQSQQKNVTIKTLEEEAKKEARRYDAQLNTLLADNASLVAFKEKTNKSPVQEKPDGRISWVNQRSQVVWINLGVADGLQRGTTFSVLDRDSTALSAEFAKASIEVTRVMESHLAEARIVTDDINDPILPSDIIFSPSWQPGEKVHFALAGFLDYNNDGKSDRSLVKGVITGNNGVIDAELTDDHEIIGKITVDTRYLIIGVKPTEKSDPVALQRYTQMLGEADRLGVEQISVGKLLRSMGFRGETRTVGLGRNATEDDFKATPKDGVITTSPGTTSGIFRDRRPPGAARSGRGAY